MSGDPPRIELLGLDDPLHALSRVVDGLATAGRSCVVIGGIAVMARTGT